MERLRAGEARRIVKAGHVTNRAHVEDIAEATRLVLGKGLPGQIWNVADDEPAPPQDVIAYAATLLGVPPPPEEPFDTAALADGCELLRRGKAGQERQGQSAARFFAGLSELSGGPASAPGSRGGARLKAETLMPAAISRLGRL